MVNLKALFQMWALLLRTANTLKSSMNFLMMDWGGLFIVGIIGHDAPMTQANSGTVVDSAKYYAVRRLAWLGRMVFAGIVRRRGPACMKHWKRKQTI